MSKERRWLMVLVVVGLLAGLSLACGLGAPSAPPAAEATATPVEEETPEAAETPETAETPEAEETPEAAETPEAELPFALEESALNDLDSYTYHFSLKFKGVTEGELQSGTLEGDGKIQNQPTKALDVIWKSTNGEETYMEYIYIEEEEKMWILSEEGGEWMESPMTDPSLIESFTLLGLWGTLFFETPEDAKFVGLEVVNGIPARHYRATEFAGVEAGCTFTTAEQDWWVAVTGNYPVKGTVDASGTCEGESGEFHFLVEINNVNQPVDIEPPM